MVVVVMVVVVLARAVSWMVAFLIDVVKSNIQVTVNRMHRRSFQVALRRLVGKGWGAAYRGLGSTLWDQYQ